MGNSSKESERGISLARRTREDVGALAERTVEVPNEEENSASFKVMEYNVLYGFHKQVPWPETPILEEHRLQAAQRTVAEEDPEILVLIEACFGAENARGVLLDYQQLFSYPHMHYAPSDHEWGTCLLSKYPLTATTEVLGRGKNFISADLQIGDNTLRIDAVHPSVTASDQEKVSVLGQHIESDSHYMLVGDFNSLSDEDTYDYDAMCAAFQKFAGERAKDLVDNLFDIQFIPYLKERGLMDAFPIELRHHTIPTNLLSGDKKSAMRTDYFFIANLAVEEVKTLVTPETEIASDHYPISGVFRLL